MSSKNRRRYCFVTGTRAEYGLLSGLMRLVQEDPESELLVLVTGAHWVPEFGNTFRVIEQDGFPITEKVDLSLSDNSPVGVARSLAIGTSEMAQAFNRLKPDWVVLLGDRFEVLAAAQAALVLRIPIAHINGGDVTEGAMDEAIRHSVTKMAHAHFVTHEEAAARVRQLGEDPKWVFNVGHLGAESITKVPLLSREEFSSRFGFEFREWNLLVTFHPATLDAVPASEQFQELLTALDRLAEVRRGLGVIFTRPNADQGSHAMIRLLDSYVAGRPHCKVYPSLGQAGYYSAIRHVDAVVGNSSSGLYEVPLFKKATVNIGDRQRGRPQPSSVFNCAPEAQEIERAILAAVASPVQEVRNPYAQGGGARAVFDVMKKVEDPTRLLKKHFFRVEDSL